MLVTVRVKPNARESRIEEQPDGALVAHLKAPPVEGKANEELIRLLAGRYGVPRSRVHIKSGLSSRTKRVEVETGGR